jgi:hypothetical protein
MQRMITNVRFSLLLYWYWYNIPGVYHMWSGIGGGSEYHTNTRDTVQCNSATSGTQLPLPNTPSTHIHYLYDASTDTPTHTHCTADPPPQSLARESAAPRQKRLYNNTPEVGK